MGLKELIKSAIIDKKTESSVVTTLKIDGKYFHHPEIAEDANEDQTIRMEMLRGWNVMGFEKLAPGSRNPTLVATETTPVYYVFGIPLKRGKPKRRQYFE